MKRILGLLFLFFLSSCDKNSTNRNPYLQEISFRFDLNLNLPLYSSLTNTGSAVYVGNAAVGTRGAFVINTGFNSYMAWEASCPNHAPSSCSSLRINGVTASCTCEDYQYSLATGQPLTEGATYSLLFYKVQQNGTQVRIYN